MSRLAARRLIDASVTLDAADRALVDLWVNRGIDDAALAVMTGMTQEAIAVRRTRIGEQLSARLGLPPKEIQAAFDDIAASLTGSAAASGPAPALDDDARSEADRAPPIANGGAPTEPGTSPGRRRWVWSTLTLIIVVAIGMAVALTGGGGAAKPGRRSMRAATHAVAPVAPTPTPTSPSPTRAEPLGALPGGLNHATGSVRLIGAHRTLRLILSISQLPPAVSGHYEVWLYNSIIHSTPLGRLPTGVAQLSLRLPSTARRYRWIDVSLQPLGVVFHSGDSILRAVNPAGAAATG